MRIIVESVEVINGEAKKSASFASLQDSVFKRETKTVKNLLNAKADPNQIQDWKGYIKAGLNSVFRWKVKSIAPLPVAVVNEDKEIILYLLEAKADPNIEIELDEKKANTNDLVKIRDRDKNEGLRPLHIAAATGNSEIVTRLLTAKADPYLRVRIFNQRNKCWYQNTPLWLAVQKGDLATVDVLVNAGNKNDDYDGYGQDIDQSFNRAVAKDRIDIAKRLLSATPKPDIDYNIPSYGAIHRVQSPEMLKLLIDNKADCTALTVENETLLHITDDPEIVEMLIAQGIELDILDNDGQTALFDKSSKCIKLLLDAKANPNITNSRGHPPLYDAVSRRSLPAVKAFLENKNSPTHINFEFKDESEPSDEITVLFAAALLNEKGIFKLLLAHNANLGSKHKEYDIAGILKIMNDNPHVSRISKPVLAFWVANKRERPDVAHISLYLGDWPGNIDFTMRTLKAAVSQLELGARIENAYVGGCSEIHLLLTYSHIRGMRQCLTFIDPTLKKFVNFGGGREGLVIRNLFLKLNALEESLMFKQQSNYMDCIIKTHDLMEFAFKPENILGINKNFNLFSTCRLQIPTVIAQLIFSFLTGLPLADIPKWMTIVISLQKSAIAFRKYRHSPKSAALLHGRHDDYPVINYLSLIHHILFFESYLTHQGQSPSSSNTHGSTGSTKKIRTEFEFDLKNHL